MINRDWHRLSWLQRIKGWI